ncbi:MAG: Unknown protein [uncultured Sulfurovum sp.]|uniref:Uncharacterized protein n=1 Tax=uncultured Sulfurovum sp. TaxID=269237 RepID=A0A6S6SJV0_9BACT|nr:MAG: Unknown protein [uncultured Sulfurovum sp.]
MSNFRDRDTGKELEKPSKYDHEEMSALNRGDIVELYDGNDEKEYRRI